MGLQIVVQPKAEPVSLAEAKVHLRVSGTDDDALIDLLITAARRTVEQFTGRQLITQTWDWTLDRFPCWTLRPPLAPVASITSIKYIDANGAQQTLAGANYLADLTGERARITPAYGLNWPVIRCQMAAVTVRAVAGYGDDGTAVPEDIRHAIKMVLGHLYENRQDVVVANGTVSAVEIPMNSRWLLGPYQVVVL